MQFSVDVRVFCVEVSANCLFCVFGKVQMENELFVSEVLF